MSEVFTSEQNSIIVAQSKVEVSGSDKFLRLLATIRQKETGVENLALCDPLLCKIYGRDGRNV